MKRTIVRTHPQGAALLAVLVFLVMGSGVSLLHAFAQIV